MEHEKKIFEGLNYVEKKRVALKQSAVLQYHE